VKNLSSIYAAAFKVMVLQQLQHRAELFIWLNSRIIDPLMYLVIWNVIAQAQKGSVDGFSPGDFAAYYLISMLVSSLTYTAIMWEYTYRITNGMLSALLLRPLHPIHTDFVETIVNKLLILLVLLPVTGILIVMFHPTFHIRFWGVLAFFPALLAAFVLRFLLEWMLAMAAFWFTRITAINLLYSALLTFFSGSFAPLTLLPNPLPQLSMLLPFRWIISFPVELITERLPRSAILFGFFAQAAWLLLLLGCLTLLWHHALQKYTAVGL